MKDALLEIGTEHLPARFVDPALRQLEEKAGELLRAARLRCGRLWTCGTPRRLTLVLEAVEPRSDPLEKVATGPPARLLKDEQGRFTPQAAGFARSHGIAPEELQIVSGPKGELLQARSVAPGEPATKLLAHLFPQLIRELQFPTTMEWEASRLRFARPIRGLLALYGSQALRFELAGVRSGNKALGACVGAKPLVVASAAVYARRLKDQCVLVRQEDREAALSRSLDQIEARLGLRVDRDPALLEEIVFLTEHPVPVAGRFEPAFLDLPRVLLSAVLKHQLKFFPLLSPSGELAPGFIGVRDGISEGQKEVQEGYERVLEARFDDARFFHERDLKTRLESKLESLRRVVFHKDLGTLHDKAERTGRLAAWTSGHLRRNGLDGLDPEVVERIARLAYADLATEVVREFPELQGLMGGHYARRDGESERVALGVEEFYRPLSAKAPLPTHLEGAVASLCGKMDTLAALFAAGLKPTGSEDPFALRRAGMGVVRIVLEKQLPVRLEELAREALELEPGGAPEFAREQGREALARSLCEFLWQRAEACFLEMGYRQDELESVREGGLQDLGRTFRRLAAVHALRPDPDFLQLAAAFKRAANLLKQAGALANGNETVEPALLQEEAERRLHEGLLAARAEVQESLDRGDFERGLRRLVGLKPQVDRFFETVRVMDAEEGTRRNRLALLSELVRLFRSAADISRLQP